MHLTSSLTRRLPTFRRRVPQAAGTGSSRICCCNLQQNSSCFCYDWPLRSAVKIGRLDWPLRLAVKIGRPQFFNGGVHLNSGTRAAVVENRHNSEDTNM